eukprot:SAG11_NODE_418_length_9653_cov_2.465564_5_plen_139_part_00
MSISYKQDNWSSLLPRNQFSINSSVSASTGMTCAPFYVEKGRTPIMTIGLLTSHADNGQHTKHEADEYLARIETNKRLVHHKLVKSREFQKRQLDKRHREQSVLLEPGSYAYLIDTYYSYTKPLILYYWRYRQSLRPE